MPVDALIETLRQMLWVSILLSLPPLAVALVIGVSVGLLQAVTSIQEQTLSFIPKLVGIFVALIVAGPWMLAVMLDYMRQVFNGIPGLIG